MKLIPICALALMLSAAACSTKKLEPELDAFASSVEVGLQGVEHEFTEMKLDEEIKNDWIKAIAEAEGFPVIDCDGDYVDVLEIDADTPRLIALSDKCPLKILDAQGLPFEHEIGKEDVRKAAEVRRLVQPLRNYATALTELASSDRPEEVSRKFADAAKALQGLVNEGATISGGEGIKADTAKVIEAGTGLAAILVREGLEAMRYSALSSIVRNGDDAVHGAAVIIAEWVQSTETGEDDDGNLRQLSKKMEAMRTAEKKARRSVAAGDSVEDRKDMIRAFDVAYKDALQADESANWRTFIAIAVAHRALKHAFEKPLDFAAFKEARERLDDLVQHALILKAALDDDG